MASFNLSKRRFKVEAGRKNLKIDSIKVDEKAGSVMISLNKSLDLESDILVSYKDLKGDQSTGVLESSGGIDVASFKYTVENSSSSPTTPTVEEASYSEGIINLSFDFELNANKVSPKKFKAKLNGRKVKVLSVDFDEDDLTSVDLGLQLKENQFIDSVDTLLLSYRDPKGDQRNKVLESMFGADVESFKNLAVDTF